jgi:predicted HAD superfamily hydrolase
MTIFAECYSLKRQFEDGLANADVLSLDIFDTCLLRRVGHPTHVFRLMDSEMRHSPRFSRLTGGCAGFLALRTRCESLSREVLMKQISSSEVTLDEIYRELQTVAKLSDEDVAELKRLELEAERKLLLPNPQILDLAKIAVKAGKKVVYVSDMYLPEEFVTEILRTGGFPIADGSVFISGEHRMSKWEGDLYDLVAERIRIPLSKWFHVGDNCAADVDKAREKGIKAYHYPKIVDVITAQDLAGRSGREFLPTDARRSFALGLRDMTLGLAYLEGGRETDFWFRLGFERGGLLILGFANWLATRCLDEHISTLVFLARDGHIFKRCFDLICKWRGMSVNSIYMYASRKALQFPALVGYGTEERDFLLSFGVGTVGEYLSRCDLDPSQYRREILEAGFAGPDDRAGDPDSYPKLCHLFNQLHKAILRRAADQSKLVSRYLDQIEIPAKGQVGLVDIGWYGSLQQGFQRFMRLTDREVRVHGYYLGLHNPAKYRIARGQRMESYLTYLAEPEEMHVSVMASVELIEFLLLAPHGTCLGFSESPDGVIEPVLSEGNADELVNVEKAARVQEGVMAFLELVRPIIEDFPHIDIDPIGAFYPYAQTTNDPTLEEAKLLGGLKHAEGFGNSALECLTEPIGPQGKIMWERGASVLRANGE